MQAWMRILTDEELVTATGGQAFTTVPGGPVPTTPYVGPTATQRFGQAAGSGEAAAQRGSAS